MFGSVFWPWSSCWYYRNLITLPSTLIQFFLSSSCSFTLSNNFWYYWETYPCTQYDSQVLLFYKRLQDVWFESFHIKWKLCYSLNWQLQSLTPLPRANSFWDKGLFQHLLSQCCLLTTELNDIPFSPYDNGKILMVWFMDASQWKSHWRGFVPTDL